MTRADPVQILSSMYFYMTKAKDLLMQVRELPMYNDIFKPGEQTSIDIMIQKTDERMEFIKELQSKL